MPSTSMSGGNLKPLKANFGPVLSLVVHGELEEVFHFQPHQILQGVNIVVMEQMAQMMGEILARF